MAGLHKSVHTARYHDGQGQPGKFCTRPSEKATEAIAKSELPRLSPEAFKQEINQLDQKLLRGGAVQKDLIVQNLFLNLHIGDENIASYTWKEPFATLIKNNNVQHGGDWVSLLETRPLEDILADIAVGWNDMQRCIGKVRANVATEVAYVL
ncbi:MAG TPA: hypothetical protein VLA88_01635 [Candidatus Saccharimonadales bacterium]|nr:hypothetical protein [Candidatus Saccharimonadales bacterium]